ncbi:MAG: helix-turn-helix transcriptional regulator [Candidatus Aminicenantes bacterium]|nr:helix-turn-helix transcriptional regulator [Candidatus Aminicenantes bacterium]
MKKAIIENPELIAFGRRLKDIRRKLIIPQKDFAEKLQMSGSFLSEVEKGKAKPGYEFLKSLILKFNINLIYLFKPLLFYPRTQNRILVLWKGIADIID